MKMTEFARHSRGANDARVGSMLFVVGVFLVAIMVVFSTTDAIPMGVDEGEMPPNIEGKSHRHGAGTSWENFNLYDLTVSNWTKDDYNATWFVIEFMSTDCPVCMNFGDEIDELSTVWDGRVSFIAVAVDFKFNDDFSSTREEIVAFQEKTDFIGCSKGKANCNSRDGGPHVNVLYVDDRDASSMEEWDVGGTPTSFILSPNGVVIWNQKNNEHEDLAEALFRLVPSEGLGA